MSRGHENRKHRAFGRVSGAGLQPCAGIRGWPLAFWFLFCFENGNLSSIPSQAGTVRVFSGHFPYFFFLSLITAMSERPHYIGEEMGSET